jgi:ribulose-phosphate 3-epimerase
VTAGADIISVHPESTHQLAAVLEQIRAAGCAAGVVLNPATPVSAVEHVLPLVDVLVVMCVSQGSKHVYLDEACRKVRALRAMCDERALDPWIEVDGGVSTRNCNRLVRAGATVMVAGGSIFSAGDSREAIAALLTAARSDPDHEDRDAARSRAAAPRDADRHWK